MTTKPGVQAFVIFEKKVLLILRDDKPSIQHPNLWNLPGGGIEKDETEIAALRRELKEEINLEPRNIHYLDKSFFDDGEIVYSYWIVINYEEKDLLKLGEGQRMEFYAFEDLETLSLIPNLKKYLEVSPPSVPVEAKQ